MRQSNREREGKRELERVRDRERTRERDREIDRKRGAVERSKFTLPISHEQEIGKNIRYL